MYLSRGRKLTDSTWEGRGAEMAWIWARVSTGIIRIILMLVDVLFKWKDRKIMYNNLKSFIRLTSLYFFIVYFMPYCGVLTMWALLCSFIYICVCVCVCVHFMPHYGVWTLFYSEEHLGSPMKKIVTTSLISSFVVCLISCTLSFSWKIDKIWERIISY